jgi:hypothetical protein
MTQTITVRKDGWYHVNTGLKEGILPEYPTNISASLKVRLQNVAAALQTSGLVEVHSEKGEWRQFEHVVSPAGVEEKIFGSTISPEDFDDIIALAAQDLDAALNPPEIEPPAPDL